MRWVKSPSWKSVRREVRDEDVFWPIWRKIVKERWQDGQTLPTIFDFQDDLLELMLW